MASKHQRRVEHGQAIAKRFYDNLDPRVRGAFRLGGTQNKKKLRTSKMAKR